LCISTLPVVLYDKKGICDYKTIDFLLKTEYL